MLTLRNELARTSRVITLFGLYSILFIGN